MLLIESKEYLTLKEDLKKVKDLQVRSVLEDDLEQFLEFLIKWKG